MSNFVEQARRKRWSAQTGWQDVRTWEGPGDERDAFLVSGTIPSGYADQEIAQELDGWTTITCTYADASATGTNPEPGLVTRNWTLEHAIENVPLIGHPKAMKLDRLAAQAPNSKPESWTYLIQLSAAYYRYLMEQWKKNEGDKPTLLHPYGDGVVMVGELGSIVGATSEDYEFAKGLADALVKDEESTYPEFSYVLRKTDVVTNAGTMVAAHTYVGRFLTTSTLSATEPTLPAAALIGYAGLSSLYWLKQPPQVQQVSGGLFQIQQDYLGKAAFFEWLYGAAL